MDEGRQGQAGRDEVQRRDVLEVAVGDQGGRGVADDRDQDLRQGEGVAAGQVGDGEDADATEAEGQAREAAGAQRIGCVEEAGQQDADDRYARDQQARRRAGEVAFGVGQGVPGADDLDDREREHRSPVLPHVPGQARPA
ncbi:hypothetical protein NGM36_26080 [Streptomyces mutabilis]|nr:hypothetical protein [Streptomyces mutabilis]MCZ9353194.1 hypothetical protein [Streptomyces mutabilis]